MFLKYLIICPLVFLAGFVDAIAGGGGLISLPAYIISGLPIHNCIATNKMSSCMGTAVATVRYAAEGYVNWKIAIPCVVCALTGAPIGAKLALMVSDHYFKIIMLVVIPLTALYVLRPKALPECLKAYSYKRTVAVGMISALVIGIYDGFYGPGTGTFLLLALTSLAHMDLKQANGITKVINLTTNVSALVVYFMNGKAILLLGLTAGLFNMAGNFLGTRSFDSKGRKIVKPVMIAVLTVFFIKIIVELVF